MIQLNIGTLKRISIIYLSLGHLIFFVGWLRPFYAVISVCLLLLAYFLIFKNLKTNEVVRISKRDFVLIAISTLVWALFSGSGGFGYQNDDYFKHNALMNDLIVQKWPLLYFVEGKKYYLSHYLGYYGVAPALFGWIGWRSMNLANFVFTYIGILLSFFWFFRYLGKFKFWFVWLFILFSGIQLFSFLYLNAEVPFAQLMANQIKLHGNLFWYNSFKLLNLTYESNTAMFFWGPQHAIPAWLGIGMLLSDWQVEKNLQYTPFYLSLLVFWSPLVLIGIAPYFIYALLDTRFKNVFNAVNLLIAPLLFLLIASYILAIESSDLMHNFTITTSRENLTILQQIGIYLFFLAMEVGLWWVIAYRILKDKLTRPQKQLYIFVLVLLSLIPLWRYGIWNDWCTRVSLPSLAVLWLMVIQAFLAAKKTIYRVVLVVVLFLASLDSVLYFGGSAYEYISHYRKTGKLWPLPAQGAAGDLQAICVQFPMQQFIAKPDTFFFTYFGKTRD